MLISRRGIGVLPGDLCPACNNSPHQLEITDKELLPIQNVEGNGATVGPLECEEAGECINF